MATTSVDNVFEGAKFIEAKQAEIWKNPDIFYKPQLEKANDIKQLSLKSYTIAVSDEDFKGRSLSELLTNGFDEEQIWQQADLLNQGILVISDIIRKFDLQEDKIFSDSFLSNLPSNKSNCMLPFDNHVNKSKNGNIDGLSDEDSSAEEDYAFDDDSDSNAEFDTKLEKDQLSQKESEFVSDDDLHTNSNTELKRDKLPQKISEYASDNDDDSNLSPEFDSKPKKKQLSEKKSYSSVVDDQFFKLSKLENFLRIEDLKEERGEDDMSNDEIDLFQDIPSDNLDDSDDESEDEQDKPKKSARDLMYDDFFDDPESELENNDNSSLNGKDENIMEKDEEFSFDENDSDGEMEIDEKGGNGQNQIQANSVSSGEDRKTNFELEQEKLKKEIQEYEKKMLQPLPWHLTGEVAAEKRPVNSLLEQEVDFECSTKQDLLVDKDLTEKIEEITIMAIRNKAFFDVERKYKPTEDIINYKKEVALEQTKSKKSLAEVYEEDYLKKQHKQDAEEEEDPKHKEIKKLMDSLFPQLHALFSHIPKPAIPEIKIVTNLPAITVEEVAPTNVSDATLLAPEEVKKKTGVVKGKTERTDTDRKRERRKKKIYQRLKEKKKLQKLESQKDNPSAKVSKLEKIQTLKKLKQHKNTKIASVDEGGKIKSSKDFFSRLQDTMDTKNKNKISGKKVKNK